MAKAFARPDGQLQAGLQIKERHGAMFELLADNPLRLEAQTIAIEAKGALQVVHGDRDHGDYWFHVRSHPTVERHACQQCSVGLRLLPVRYSINDRHSDNGYACGSISRTRASSSV